MRSGVYNEIRADVVARLIKVVEKNPYAKFFRLLQSYVIEENTTIRINHNSVPDQ